ncbi:MAG: alanine racemase [Treponema sp.]|jgi:alanine racemase|nr:alanine racemase [Treponema sp.]
MRTRAIIHLDHFFSNFQAIQARAGARRICVAVKADAYGHGALEIAEASLEAGAFCLAVATINEGAQLRNGGISAPIMLFSQFHPDEISAFFEIGLIPFVSDADFINLLNKQAGLNRKKLPVHLKIDSGMGRIGCPAEEAVPLARLISESAGLELAGVATHFAVSDSTEPRDINYTQIQLARFKEAVDAIRKAGIDPGIVHAANSGAIILHPDAWLDMVRPGITIYGYKLADETCIPGFPYEPLKVEPVMELKSVVTLIKKVKAGESVSYGRTWIASRDTYAAVLPIGYADGFPRLASNKWQVMIGGNMYPLAGRICMDQCLVDIGPQPLVKRWDEAVIFGAAPNDASALARVIGTIPYEITCNINKRVPRIYVR